MSLSHCLLLVRHGQTQLNVENRMATHTDVPLTRTGHEQAALLTQSLAGAAFDGAYTSPLRRATATAEAALAQARLAGKPLRDSRLIEPSAGPFEGLAFADLERGDDEELCSAYARYTDETNPVYPSGAESLERSSARARAFLTEIEATPGRFFAASHGRSCNPDLRVPGARPPLLYAPQGRQLPRGTVQVLPAASTPTCRSQPGAAATRDLDG